MRALATVAVCLMLSGPVIGQETTNSEQLRATIEDIRDWPPDYDGMRTKLAKAVRKGKSKMLKRLTKNGDIESVEFIESFKGVDLYYVRFHNNRWFMRFARGDDGKIVSFRYWIVGY